MKKHFTLTFFTSVLLTVIFSGAIFAQQRGFYSKNRIASLPQTEKDLYGSNELLINGCDTVDFAKGFGTAPSWTPYVWTASTSGFVFGPNSYGDKEKGNYFDLAAFSTATHITGTYVWFADAYSSTPAKTVSINVYDNSGTAGAPGTLLGSQTLTMATIMSTVAGGYISRVVFPTPIAIPVSKKVYVTCDFTNLSWTGAAGTDSLSIVASDTLEENPGIIWEKTSTNTWHALDDLTTWDMKKAALFIMPFVTNNITAPTATLTPTPSNASICPGSSITLNPAGSVTPYGYSWYATPGYSSAAFAGQSLVMTYTAASTYTVGYNAKGCGVINTATVAVVVNAKPTLTASSNSPLCEGNPLQLTATTNGTTYIWTGPNAYTSSQQNPTIATASVSNSGNYTVLVSNANSCTAAQTVSVTVNPCTGIDPIANETGMSIVQDANNQFYLIMDGNGGEVSVNIYNIAGTKMSSAVVAGTNRKELNTQALSPGMYFVQVNSSERTITKKIIITR